MRNMWLQVFFSSLVVGTLGQANLSPSAFSTHIFNIYEFGAKGDGVHLDYSAVKAAFAAAAARGMNFLAFASSNEN